MNNKITIAEDEMAAVFLFAASMDCHGGDECEKTARTHREQLKIVISFPQHMHSAGQHCPRLVFQGQP